VSAATAVTLAVLAALAAASGLLRGLARIRHTIAAAGVTPPDTAQDRPMAPADEASPKKITEGRAGADVR